METTGTITWNNYSESRNSSHRGGIWLLLIMVIVMLAVGVILSDHALKHDEATSIRDCLNKNGPYMVMKNMYEPTWYLLCQIDSKHWGIQAVNKDGIEKTAFSPGDGSYRALMEYMNRIAVRFKGTLPWMH